ncbi:MAG: hypothetical protein II332_00510 [Kiritimatiellae bacterium]|nr:hypothetical protein [Kiritimatiellia bacterium]
MWNINFDNYTQDAKVSATEESQGKWDQHADDESIVTNKALSLNTQGEDLKWTPKAPTDEKYDSVIFDADVTFVASDIVPTTDKDMQTALYLKATDAGNVLSVWSQENGEPTWVDIEKITIADNTEKHVTITINYNAKESATPMVTLQIGDDTVEYPVAVVKEEVTSVAFRGTGTIDNFEAQTNIDAVAYVGTEPFTTYEEAFAYLAENGGDFTFAVDPTETLKFGEYTFSKNTTIDLNGNIIEAAFVVDGGAELTINNGTVNAPMGYDVIYIKNGKAIVGATANLYASDNCVVFMKNTENADADLILDVQGKLYVENDTGYAAIQGNGINVTASEITILDGAVVSHKYDTAIYHPQNGTLTIGAATIKGTTGIEMRAGSLVVDGATIVATGTPASTDENNDGTTTVGAAIALSQHSTKLPTSVTVNAGALTGEYAFLQYNGNETASENISATIGSGVELNGAVVVTETGFAMPKADDGSYTLASGVAIVGNNVYETLADAVAAAAAGDTVTLIADATASEIVTINKAITLDGNGFALTSTAARAINVDGADGSTIKNLKIVTTGERGINIINDATNVTIANVDVTAFNYAVNVAGTAPDAVVTITGSTITGLNAVNVAAANSNITIADSTINCNDNAPTEKYGAISLHQNAVNATVAVTGTTFNVAGDSKVAINGAAGATVTINGSTDSVANMVAAINYADGYSYMFATLEDAIAKAEAGETVKLLADVTATEIITINKAITLDGNGKTLTSTATRAINVETTGEVVIKNITIDAAERAINIINEPATVTLTDVTATADNNAVMIATSAGAAKVTVENCDFTGLAVINVAGADAQVTVADSKITNVDANSDENYGAITVWTSAEGATVEVTNSEIVVADDSYEAFVFPGEATVTGVDNVTYCVATVGDAGYDTIEEALEEAKDGDTIVLQRDVTASDIVVINKAITLDGNGKTLTSTAARAINVDGADGATIKNLTIVTTGERGINIIGGATNVTIDNVDVTAFNYAVNVAASASGAVVTITDSTLTGLNAFNAGAANAEVTIADSTINCNDNRAGEKFGAISLNQNAAGTQVVASNVTFNLKDDSVVAINGASDKGATIIINGSTEAVENMVAAIDCAGGYSKLFTSLAAAIEEAEAGQTVKLLTDVKATEIITINKAITLDGNGKTLTSTAARAINVDGANGATIENLTIVTTGERGINIIGGATNVTIDNVDVTAANYAVNVAASASGAVVTITDSILTGLNAFNAGAANAEVTIADSTINCNDNRAGEKFGAISLNQDAAGTQVVVTGSQFYIKDDSVVAINGASGKGATITIDGSSDAVTSMVAAIDEANGYSNLFTTLAGAFAKADAGETVKLIANATEDVAIAATTILDLNGFAATGTFTITDAAAKFYAAEGLTVASGVENYVVVYADGCYYVEEKIVEFAPVAVAAIAINGDTAELTIAGEYTEVKVYFCENLGDEWAEVSADFDGSVATVSATTTTGFFKVEAR